MNYSLDDLRARFKEILVSTGALMRLDHPVALASGEMSQDFVDAKLAVAEPQHLELAGAAMTLAASEAGAAFEAVGGLVMGAVPFTFAVAALARVPWFLIRKEPKGRGTNRYTEGTRIRNGMPVMIVEDVTTTGGSIQTACERAEAEGAKVVFASTLVDRGESARAWFDQRCIAYTPILTYADLGIDPVGAAPLDQDAS